MGSEDEVEQSFGRPCRQLNGRSKRTCELTASVVPRGTSFHRSVEPECPPVESIGSDLAGLLCCCRVRQTRIRAGRRESQSGLFCQTETTSDKNIDVFFQAVSYFC
jgi:hypothetical protein